MTACSATRWERRWCRCAARERFTPSIRSNHFFLINEMIIPGSSYWNIGIGRDIGDVELDEEGIATMKTLGRNMAWLLENLKSPMAHAGAGRDRVAVGEAAFSVLAFSV